MSLSGVQIQALLAATIGKTLGDSDAVSYSYSKGRTSNAPSDATILFNNGYTMTSSGTQSLTLSSGLVDALGQAAAFTKVYGVLVLNKTVTPGVSISIGGNFFASLDVTSSAIHVGPSGHLFLLSPVDGYTVTVSTADVLLLTNLSSTTSVSVQIAILGK